MPWLGMMYKRTLRPGEDLGCRDGQTAKKDETKHDTSLASLRMN